MKKQFYLDGMLDRHLWSGDLNITDSGPRGGRPSVEAYALRSLIRWGCDRIRIIPEVRNDA